MVEVAGKPLIGHVLDMVINAGCTDIVTNIHYKPAPLLHYLDNQYANKVMISDETDMLLDSGGGVVKALEKINDEIFYIINADCIWSGAENALLQMAAYFDPDKMDILKLLAPSQKALGFDENNIYNLSPEGHISKADDAAYSFTGIQIAKKSLFKDFKPEAFSIREIWNNVKAENRFYGMDYRGKWLHIGTPDAVLLAERYFEPLSLGGSATGRDTYQNADGSPHFART